MNKPAEENKGTEEPKPENPPAAPGKVSETKIVLLSQRDAFGEFINGVSWMAGCVAVVLVVKAGVWVVQKWIAKGEPVPAV
jgi:hypothetical protein